MRCRLGMEESRSNLLPFLPRCCCRRSVHRCHLHLRCQTHCRIATCPMRRRTPPSVAQAPRSRKAQPVLKSLCPSERSPTPFSPDTISSRPRIGSPAAGIQDMSRRMLQNRGLVAICSGRLRAVGTWFGTGRVSRQHSGKGSGQECPLYTVALLFVGVEDIGHDLPLAGTLLPNNYELAGAGCGLSLRVVGCELEGTDFVGQVARP